MELETHKSRDFLLSNNSITYYWRNQQAMDAYLSRWLASSEAAYQEQQRNPPLVVRRLQELKKRRQPDTMCREYL